MSLPQESETWVCSNVARPFYQIVLDAAGDAVWDVKVDSLDCN
jgi:hypothetical protein